MKHLLYISLVSLLLTACYSYRSLNVNNLTTGMTKADVENLAGTPDRVLAVNNTRNGYQEVLQYRTSYNEIYALEFWDNYLVGYEYLYDDTQYVPSNYPPAYVPDYGRPIVIIHEQPSRPSRPSNNHNNRPNRPSNNHNSRPSRPNRPSSNHNSSNSRPTTNRPTTRPINKPTNSPNNSTSRPSSQNKNNSSGRSSSGRNSSSQKGSTQSSKESNNASSTSGRTSSRNK